MSKSHTVTIDFRSADALKQAIEFALRTFEVVGGNGRYLIATKLDHLGVPDWEEIGIEKSQGVEQILKHSFMKFGCAGFNARFGAIDMSVVAVHGQGPAYYYPWNSMYTKLIIRFFGDQRVLKDLHGIPDPLAVLTSISPFLSEALAGYESIEWRFSEG